MYSLSVGQATDVGRVRDHNEDAKLADPPIFVVADGMGGHAAGEVASAMAVAAFARFAGQDDVTVDQIADCIADINAQVLAEMDAEPETAGMGTTITGVAITTIEDAPHWIVFNVGDSRVYLRSAGQLSRRTIDHSEVEEMVIAGYLTPAEARVHPRRHVVTRSIGSEPAPEADVWVLAASPGDQMLVCSDGLTNEVDDAEIDLLLGSSGTAQDIADGLVERALIAGGRDNVTVIVAVLDS